MKKYASIFNDVLSPITPGPSSSNTCAPCRIARTVLQIFGGRPGSVLVEMCDHGGYFDTFYGMQSDKAFIAGFLGKDALSYDMSKAYSDAKAEGMTVDFQFVSDLPPLPSELCRMTLTSSDPGTREPMSVTAVSIGGGTFVISDIDGCPTDIRGGYYEILVFFERGSSGEKISASLTEEMKKALSRMGELSFCPGPRYDMICVTCQNRPDSHLLSALEQLSAVDFVRMTEPEYPFVIKMDAVPPFSTPTELIRYMDEKNVPLWRAAADYEAALSGWDDDRILSYAEKLYDISEEAKNTGLSGGFSFEGVTSPRASQLEAAFREKTLIPTGIGKRGVPAALAIMEHSNARGVIVCMPTGGSSGIVPAAIESTVLEMNLTKEDGVKALLAAGLIGVFLFETDYSGFYGCQAEVGCATAMAAAALCTFLTEDGSAACSAASLAIQNVLGLICDPIAGYVQIPCLIRNMTAVPTAAVCANAAACGFSAQVPLEEMAAAILRVGKELRPCNALGVCATPTGCRMNQEIIKQRGLHPHRS